MNIHCISCGHQIKLDDSTYIHYKGPVRCWVCRSVLMVNIVDGCMESVSTVGIPVAWAAPEPVSAEPRQELSPKVGTPDPGTSRPGLHHD